MTTFIVHSSYVVAWKYFKEVPMHARKIMTHVVEKGTGRNNPYFLRPCLLPSKNTKNFKIPYHIESLDACIEY